MARGRPRQQPRNAWAERELAGTGVVDGSRTEPWDAAVKAPLGPRSSGRRLPLGEPLAHEDSPVAPVEHALRLLEAQLRVDGDVLAHLLVGIEPDLRQPVLPGPRFREGHQLAPEAFPLMVGRDGH